MANIYTGRIRNVSEWIESTSTSSREGYVATSFISAEGETNGLSINIEYTFRKFFSENKYNKNDLDSACDYYNIGAISWDEIIKYEEGLNQAISDRISSYIALRDKIAEEK